MRLRHSCINEGWILFEDHYPVDEGFIMVCRTTNYLEHAVSAQAFEMKKRHTKLRDVLLGSRRFLRRFLHHRIRILL